MLAVSRRLGALQNAITLDMPTPLSPRVQNALKADPRTVELRGLAPHFYGLGERVLGLFDEDELCTVLINVRGEMERGGRSTLTVETCRDTDLQASRGGNCGSRA